MKLFIIRLFSWWHGATLNTLFHTWRKGERVGEDEQGNVYYQGGTDSEGRTRRWVIYNGEAEGSRVPPGWHGWLHHRVDAAPVQEAYRPRDWQKPHVPNLTGSPMAYRPKGSILGQDKRPVVTGDYEAWSPGD
ncbi:MAG: NADH:ubiquinone oxidoreductase subunit NDUFA12 [Rhizobiaceae bacterium]|jgi:NADH:ubiquinone oxidoreductase subunit|nr:NADH:ubiquinone oxidoreductase subunit NDUFA12 [Rhizobiaceae bacterium]